MTRVDLRIDFLQDVSQDGGDLAFADLPLAHELARTKRARHPGHHSAETVQGNRTHTDRTSARGACFPRVFVTHRAHVDQLLGCEVGVEAMADRGVPRTSIEPDLSARHREVETANDRVRRVEGHAGNDRDGQPPCSVSALWVSLTLPPGPAISVAI